MATKVGIINIALSHLGISKEIANLETEKSEEAATARRFYDAALEATMRDFNWPFLRRFVTLALVSEDPTEEWSFSYRYPAGCVKIRRILSGTRNDNRQTRVSYKMASDSGGLLVYTDQEDAVVEYSHLVTDPLRYPSDFTMAFSYYLAFLMAPRLTGGDQFKLGDRAAKLYGVAIRAAMANSVGEEQDDEEPESEFIRERY